MTKIGKEIARKCRGLPLAAKFLGSLLHSKTKQSEWMLIRDDNIWNTQGSQRNILPTLRLSYNNLPSHLKQCFSFCAIFPKNWEIKRETLIQLWMAEGFLKAENKRSIEDFGNECFDSLIWSSFFIYPRKNELGDITRCMMHDLVHDLANDVLEDKELVSLRTSQLQNVSEVRRVQSLDEDISTTFSKGLCDAKKLRCIFIPQGPNLNPTIFSRNKHLRILHVGNSRDFPTLKLPHLRLKLRHLRYLHLTTFKFSEAVNDRSISKLYNLETLVLTRVIGIQNLLTNIQALKNLRHLDISFSKIEELPDSVTSLFNLQSLDIKFCKLKSLPDTVIGLKYLRFLDISYNLIEELPAFVITCLNLEILNVSHCSKLKAIPASVASLNNLKTLNFSWCTLLESLPEDLGALTQLRYLSLENTAIKVLPDSCADLINLEFLHLGMCDLPKEVRNWKKLREFRYFGKGTPTGIGELVFLGSLTYWVGKEEGNNGIAELGKLDLLEDLCIYGLENVRRLTDAGTTLKGKQNLRDLGLHWGLAEDKNSTVKLLEALQPPTGLRKLTITGYNGVNFPSWMCVPYSLPNLSTMRLEDCPSMEKLPAAIGQLPNLRFLVLSGMFLRSLDVEFPFLTGLVLGNNVHLKELCHSYPCLQYLYIDCSSLIKIPQFPCLTELKLNNIDHRLVSSIERSCTCLTTLILRSVENFELFPLSILQNNRNLQNLYIILCNQFQGFRVNDDENEDEVVLYGTEIHHHPIVSLQILLVTNCPVLQFLPDFRGWTSLRELYIFGCPQVKDSITYDLKSLPSLQCLEVDFIQRDEHRGDPSDFEDMINLLN